MAPAVRAFIVSALLCAAACAHAQAPTVEGKPRRYGDPFVTKRDTVVRTLSGPWQLWTHIGVGWNSEPSEVRSRYSAGLDGGVSGDRRFADRLALRARFDFTDLPSSHPQAVVVNGVAYQLDTDYGHGWLFAGGAGAALRLWQHLWIDGNAGGGYFRSGFDDAALIDPSLADPLVIAGHSGWGALWSAGARYEFQPGRRDRMLGELRVTALDRDGTDMRFYTVRFGYRAF